MRKRAIGLFGGTFDPIHNGHVHLALSLLEKHNLDEVVFCPAFISPFKLDKQPSISPAHRLEMVKRAIAPISTFSCIDKEVICQNTSYTIDTVRWLQESWTKKKEDVALFLILGEDSLPGLSKWKEIDTLLTLARPLTGSRSTFFEMPKDLDPSLLAKVRQGWTPIPVMQISSTDLRERLLAKKYCGHLVPAPVLHYIEQHKLYI